MRQAVLMQQFHLVNYGHCHHGHAHALLRPAHLLPPALSGTPLPLWEA